LLCAESHSKTLPARTVTGATRIFYPRSPRSFVILSGNSFVASIAFTAVSMLDLTGSKFIRVYIAVASGDLCPRVLPTMVELAPVMVCQLPSVLRRSCSRTSALLQSMLCGNEFSTTFLINSYCCIIFNKSKAVIPVFR